MSAYTFTLADARRYGVHEAIVLSAIEKLPKPWNVNALLSLFPFWSSKKIMAAVNSLMMQNALDLEMAK
jgi:hypothetical protein